MIKTLGPKKNIILLFLLLIVISIATITFADTLVGNDPPPKPPKATQAITPPISTLEYNLSLVVLAFGLVIIIGEVILAGIKIIDNDNAIKIILITLIITGTLYLITTGYSNAQIAPAFGLYGTIAGYLLGKMSKPEGGV